MNRLQFSSALALHKRQAVALYAEDPMFALTNMFCNCDGHYQKRRHSKEQTNAGAALLVLSLANSSCLHLLLHSEIIGPRFSLPCCISGIWPAVLPLPGGLTWPDNSLPSSMGKLLTGAAKMVLGSVSPLL